MLKKILCFLFFWGILFFAPVLVSATENSAEIDPRISSRETSRILKVADISKNDIKTYKKIFYALENNRITAARKLIKKLDNKILLGHVKAQIYLSKTYTSSYPELKSWLTEYADLPETPRIYKLARRKAPKNQKQVLPEPVFQKKFGYYSWNYQDFEHMPEKKLIFIERQVRNFAKNLNKGKTRTARIILENKALQKQLPSRYYAFLSAKLAQKYLLDNENILAQEWAQRTINREQDNATGYWIAGLSSWRLKQYKTASGKFKTLGKMKNDDWLVAAGAYWAGRSYEKCGQKSLAKQWYKEAAKYKYTFYGILGSRKAGITPDYQWTSISYYNNLSLDNYLPGLMANASVKRALILILCQQYKLAGQEIMNSAEPIPDAQKEALLFLAHKYRAHVIAMHLSKQLSTQNNNVCYDYFNYPIPHWEPEKGWRLNKALLLAVARQESSFSPHASSPAGAKGLLQLLPNTAYHITKDKSLRQDCRPLFKAEYNLELGQQYIEYLLDKPFVNGNIFYMLVAYNAGPGNLYKWLKTIKDNNDPLLFIELVPSRETRLYIERVMANYWIYQMRLGENPQTLQEVSQNKWPMLTKQ
ncbi:MAG: lytic transglycosylase domain-containing protein [Alphaproteobacteria bacterium]|nr:lytic transglycosylase domain-containing protein [Alphaproteobacteria bacterium]